jgi:hypothetical protein
VKVRPGQELLLHIQIRAENMKEALTMAVEIARTYELRQVDINPNWMDIDDPL